jgi:hypothetical protein
MEHFDKDKRILLKFDKIKKEGTYVPEMKRKIERIYLNCLFSSKMKKKTRKS